MTVGLLSFAAPAASGGGSFSDSDWPSALNRPQFNSGTNVLTWVGPIGGGANNGSPVRQTLHLIDTPGGISTTHDGQVISGLNVTAGEVQILHNGCTVKNCRIFDPHDQWYGAVIISAVVTGLTVEDCLIDGNKTSLCGIGIDGSVTAGLTATTANFYRRNFITGFENHITLAGSTGGKNVGISDNYFTACGNSDNTLFDGDMIECYSCDSVTVRHNMFDGSNSQTSSNAFNSMFNISNLGAVTNITVTTNMFANGNGTLGDGMVMDIDQQFGGGTISWSCTNNGFFNKGSNSYANRLHNGVTAALPSPNSGNYDAASQTATSGTLINGTGQV